MVLFSFSAAAHSADEIGVSLADVAHEGALTETISLTADTLALLAPIDANGDGELTQADLDARADALRVGVWDQARLLPCARHGESATLEPGYVTLKARFVCPEGVELTQEFRWLMVLPPNHRVVFGDQVAQGQLRTLHLTRSAFGSAATPYNRAELDRLDYGALGVLCVCAAAAASRRLRAISAATALFALGFWLVHRLLT
jgi:hypothetical protein